MPRRLQGVDTKISRPLETASMGRTEPVKVLGHAGGLVDDEQLDAVVAADRAFLAGQGDDAAAVLKLDFGRLVDSGREALPKSPCVNVQLVSQAALASRCFFWFRFRR